MGQGGRASVYHDKPVLELKKLMGMHCTGQDGKGKSTPGPRLLLLLLAAIGGVVGWGIPQLPCPVHGGVYSLGQLLKSGNGARLGSIADVEGEEPWVTDWNQAWRLGGPG